MMAIESSTRKPNPRGRPKASVGRLSYAGDLQRAGLAVESAAEVAGVGRSTVYRARANKSWRVRERGGAEREAFVSLQDAPNRRAARAYASELWGVTSSRVLVTMGP